MCDVNAIPVIDLGPYLAGEPGALDRAAAVLHHALTVSTLGRSMRSSKSSSTSTMSAICR